MPHSPLYLASASPRRRALLREAGFDFELIEPGVDDTELRPGPTTPAAWTMALAYLKARAAAETLPTPGAPTSMVLAADTVCIHDHEVFGQPRDRDHARRMLLKMRNAGHMTMTGVCVLILIGNSAAASRAPAFFDHEETHRTLSRTNQCAFGRLLFVDAARVTVGALSDEQVEAYLDSGGWRGKAGAYNLAERLEAGWPVRCDGDPATVMGLPMQRLETVLRSARSS